MSHNLEGGDVQKAKEILKSDFRLIAVMVQVACLLFPKQSITLSWDASLWLSATENCVGWQLDRFKQMTSA